MEKTSYGTILFGIQFVMDYMEHGIFTLVISVWFHESHDIVDILIRRHSRRSRSS